MELDGDCSTVVVMKRSQELISLYDCIHGMTPVVEMCDISDS